jgi:hypothetical protein
MATPVEALRAVRLSRGTEAWADGARAAITAPAAVTGFCGRGEDRKYGEKCCGDGENCLGHGVLRRWSLFLSLVFVSVSDHAQMGAKALFRLEQTKKISHFFKLGHAKRKAIPAG